MKRRREYGKNDPVIRVGFDLGRPIACARYITMEISCSLTRHLCHVQACQLRIDTEGTTLTKTRPWTLHSWEKGSLNTAGSQWTGSFEVEHFLFPQSGPFPGSCWTCSPRNPSRCLHRESPTFKYWLQYCPHLRRASLIPSFTCVCITCHLDHSVYF